MRLVACLFVPDTDKRILLVLRSVVTVIVVVVIVVVVVVMVMDHETIAGALIRHRRVRGRVRVCVTAIPIIIIIHQS